MDSICLICKKQYNQNSNKPILLTCGDTMCHVCIKNYKEFLKKDEFECPNCFEKVKSMNIENKHAYPKIQNSEIESPKNDEFEIYIRFRDTYDKIFLIAKKQMTVKQLKDKIEENYEYNMKNYQLCLKNL